MARRFRRIFSLGFPSVYQIDNEAGKALDALLDEIARRAVSIAAHELEEENGQRDKGSRPLRRLLPRHVEWARARLLGDSGGEPTPNERLYFQRIGRLLAETQPEVSRSGQLAKISLPAGWMCRNAGGRLRVYPTTRSLSNDGVLNRSRRRSREPDEGELAQWRRVTKVLERAAPSVGKDGALTEVLLPYGALRRGPFGLVVHEERLAPVSVTLSSDFEQEEGTAPPEPPEPEAVEESWRAVEPDPDIPIAIPVRAGGAARRNSDDLYGTVVRGFAQPRGDQARLRRKAREYARKHSCPVCRQPLRHSPHERRIHARTLLRGGPITDLSTSGHQRKLWLSKPMQSQLVVTPSFVADGPERTVLPESGNAAQLSNTPPTM